MAADVIVDIGVDVAAAAALGDAGGLLVALDLGAADATLALPGGGSIAPTRDPRRVEPCGSLAVARGRGAGRDPGPRLTAGSASG